MRDFLKYTFASLVALLIFMGLSIGGLVSLIILAASRDSGPRVKNESVLTFDLGLDITDSERSAAGAINEPVLGGSEPSISLNSVIQAIDEAAKDKRIVGLYLYGQTETAGNPAGYAMLKEVREALQRFKASGKKIVAYDTDWRESEYYLASVAETIALNPAGNFEFNGLQAEGTFFAGALEKLGVGVQVTRVGKYKSAVEPFLLKQRSPESRQQTQQLLGDLWSEMLTAIGKDRQLTPPQLQQIANRSGVVEPQEALQQKLVTKLAHQDEMLQQLQQIAAPENDNKSFRQISLEEYAPLADRASQRGRNQRNKVAVVYAEGEIVSGEGDREQVGGDRFAKLLRKLRQDDDVKAVVLRVNSPGGSASASDIIQREMILTRKAKPVVVSMGAIAASGGYWISTYSDRIFAEPNTITGSIGVFGLLPNVQQLGTRLGITSDAVKTGQYADITTIRRPKTPQEMAMIQKSVDRIYNEFITKVAESRKLDKAKVAEIAQGRVWSGKQAKALGLVDEFGGLEVAIQDAAKRAKLGDDWSLDEYPRPLTFREILFGNVSSHILANHQPALKGPLMAELKQMQADLAVLTTLNDPRGVYARMPITLRID